MLKHYQFRIFLFCLLLIGKIYAQQTHVLDNNFEQALIDLGYDDALDDSILTASISDILELDHTDENINDLSGIEGLKNLSTLVLKNNQLTSLDISNNIHLKDLMCHYNQLKDIDHKNQALENLFIKKISLFF